MRRPAWPGALLYVLLLISSAAMTLAAKMAFTSPNFDKKVAKSGYSYFMFKDEVEISWTTPFDKTTLAVFQKVKGNFYHEILANANGRDNTTYRWTAMTVNQHPVMGAHFHFYLQNADDASSYVNSRLFMVQFGVPVGNVVTTTNSATGTSPPLPTTSTAKSSAKTTAKATSSAAAKPSSAKGSMAGSFTNPPPVNLAIPLGVGIGVGLPAFAALCAIVFFSNRRKLRKQEQDRADEKSAAYGKGDSTPSSSTPVRGKEIDRFSRESGALGPWRENMPSTQAQQDGWYVPFSVLATHEETSRPSTSHLDEFDFERPGYRDADEMSEARRSIHSARGDGFSSYAASAISRPSFENAPEVPQIPHEAHHDANWPLR